MAARKAARVALGAWLCVVPAGARALAQDWPVLNVARTSVPPRIDGLLDDPVWTGAPLETGMWLSYSPVRGDAEPEHTEVRAAYDDRFLYFAFHCITDDPGSVRTTISKRDSAFNDDWIGLSLDSTGTGQTSVHLMINPSGVQMDAVNTTASGEKFESDFVWFSAGRRTDDGFVVEVALPLETLRFSTHPPVTMGVLFWRHVSRSGMSYSWPDLPPGQWVFDRHARLMFPDLKPRRLFELLPSAVYPLSQTRTAPDRWTGVNGHPELSVNVKYGITPQITLDATANPDFSQVESDAFQVQVNQRFPTYFSEKRPFFMEGLGLFSLASTNGDYNMRNAVHTRRIVNPAWGAKVIGSAAHLSFGLLSASDETPDTSEDRTAAQSDKLFTIGRAVYGFGQSDYIGAIATDTVAGGRHNRVIGGDVSWKPGTSQTLSLTTLFSRTRLSGPSDSGADGSAAQLSYRYDTRRLLIAPQLEHYSRGFEMDTAFYNRVGFTSGLLYSEVNFYPGWARRLGVMRIHPLILARSGHDDIQGGEEGFVTVGTAFDFERQGFLRIQHGTGHEPWLGRRYRTGDPLGAFGSVQLFQWLNVGGNYFHRGWATFYDPVTPFQGRSTTGGMEVTWQPTVHFNQRVSYDLVRFSRADDGSRVFAVDIVNAKTVYQFNTRFLVRLLEQFDNSRHQLLSDVLASYEFVPGTVFHAGYGSITEERDFQDTRFVQGAGSYVTVSRGLFFKASYLHRF